MPLFYESLKGDAVRAPCFSFMKAEKHGAISQLHPQERKRK